MIRFATLIGCIPEYVVDPGRRRRRHHHRLKTPPKRFLRPGLVAADGPQSLQKRPRTMRLIQQNKAVVGDQRRIDGPSAGTAPVGTEQQPRADLIHCRCDDGWLQRIARPGFGSIHPTAQRMDGERPFAFESGCCASSDPPQIVGNGLQNAIFGLFQLVHQPPRPLMRFIDDHPAVNHEEDAARRGDRLRGIQPRCLSCQGEQGNVHTGGLAGRSRQGDGVGPGRERCPAGARRSARARQSCRGHPAFQHPLRQILLPAKRGFAPQRREEICEIRGA